MSIAKICLAGLAGVATIILLVWLAVLPKNINDSSPAPVVTEGPALSPEDKGLPAFEQTLAARGYTKISHNGGLPASWQQGMVVFELDPTEKNRLYRLFDNEIGLECTAQLNGRADCLKLTEWIQTASREQLEAVGCRRY